MDFVKALHSMRVLENGEYMIISIDDFMFDPENNAKEYTSRSKYLRGNPSLINCLINCRARLDYLDPYLPMTKKADLIQAFRSVLKLTPSHPRNPKFKYVNISVVKLVTFTDSSVALKQRNTERDQRLLQTAALLRAIPPDNI